MSDKQARAAKLAYWRNHPLAFMRDCLRDPESGAPFALYPEEAAFVRRAFTPTSDGRLPYRELLFSAPKKSGKTTLAAMCVLYVIVCLGGGYAEALCAANDFEQASSRVFAGIVRIIGASPLLRGIVKITANQVLFKSTGATILALASDYAGAAGANPTIIVFDELWGYMSERARRLFDELVVSPARKISVRLTVTTAGFGGESELLESLIKRGVEGGVRIGTDLFESPGMLTYQCHELRAPWQGADWVDEMRRTLRSNQFLRLVENRTVTSDSPFVDLELWDACINPGARPVVADKRLPVWVGVDASVKRDSTAIAVCAWDERARQVRLVAHRVFQPSPEEPLDFEASVEATLAEMARSFRVVEIKYDPYQLVSVAQRLARAGLPMSEFAQTVPNLTEASSNLYELVKGRNLVLYPDADIRKSASQAIAVETSRGWRIAKEKARHKIDIIVALAQAALGAAKSPGSVGGSWTIRDLATGELLSEPSAPFGSNYQHPADLGAAPASTFGARFVRPDEPEPEPIPSSARISQLPGHEPGGLFVLKKSEDSY